LLFNYLFFKRSNQLKTAKIEYNERRMLTMKNPLLKISVLALGLLSLIVSGCATYQGTQGAALGTAVGGVSGALIDHHNPWRGAVIGGGLGAILGGGLGEIAGSQSAPPPRYAYPDRYDYRYRYR
jgi:hypothetical protein